MAKKSRKTRAAARPVKASQRAVNNTPQAQATSRYAEKQSPPVAVNSVQSGHYDYVKRDLISISIIAAALILVLIVLTFIPALKT